MCQRIIGDGFALFSVRLTFDGQLINVAPGPVLTVARFGFEFAGDQEDNRKSKQTGGDRLTDANPIDRFAYESDENVSSGAASLRPLSALDCISNLICSRIVTCETLFLLEQLNKLPNHSRHNGLRGRLSKKSYHNHTREGGTKRSDANLLYFRFDWSPLRNVVARKCVSQVLRVTNALLHFATEERKWAERQTKLAENLHLVANLFVPLARK